MLRHAEAGGGPSGCSGGLSGMKRWLEWSGNVGGLLQRRPATERVLEAAAVFGRSGTELLEHRHNSRSDTEGRVGLEHSNARRWLQIGSGEDDGCGGARNAKHSPKYENN